MKLARSRQSLIIAARGILARNSAPDWGRWIIREATAPIAVPVPIMMRVRRLKFLTPKLDRCEYGDSVPLRSYRIGDGNVPLIRAAFSALSPSAAVTPPVGR